MLQLELTVRPSFNNDNGGTFILIEPGQIMDIVIREPFFIGSRPVTQVEWSSVMGNNPSKFQDGWSAGLRPVESVSWFDCQMYIDKLNAQETNQRLGLSGIWRLPTAEEWNMLAEQAQKLGGTILIGMLTLMKWLGMLAIPAQPLGKSVKKANDWGLFDCHGNVAEWTDTENGSLRVTKGGSWLMESESTTSSAKGSSAMDKKSDAIGLRLVWAPI